jgi:hypothetical protein
MRPSRYPRSSAVLRFVRSARSVLHTHSSRTGSGVNWSPSGQSDATRTLGESIRKLGYRGQLAGITSTQTTLRTVLYSPNNVCAWAWVVCTPLPNLLNALQIYFGGHLFAPSGGSNGIAPKGVAFKDKVENLRRLATGLKTQGTPLPERPSRD